MKVNSAPPYYEVAVVAQRVRAGGIAAEYSPRA
jgi:hypothetical protein